MLSSVTLPSTLAVLANCARAGAAVPSEINRAMTTRGPKTRKRSNLGTNLIANPPTCAVCGVGEKRKSECQCLSDSRQPTRRRVRILRCLQQVCNDFEHMFAFRTRDNSKQFNASDVLKWNQKKGALAETGDSRCAPTLRRAST